MADASLFFDVFARDKTGGTFKKVAKDTDSLKDKFGELKAVVAGAFVGAGVASFLKSAVMGASDLAETISKSDQVFGSSASSIHSWAADAASSMGLSQQAAESNANAMGLLFTQVGFQASAAADMSKAWTQLAVDLGSFNNADPTEILGAMQAATRGEFDELQRFVPSISAAKVQTEALAISGKKLTSELTEQDKVLAVQALIFAQTGKAQGDFARTQEGTANSLKILQANFVNMRDELGARLLPTVNRVIEALSGPGLDAFASLATTGIGLLIPALQVVTPLVSGFAAVVDAIPGPVLAGVAALIALHRISGPLGGLLASGAGKIREFGASFKTASAQATGFGGKMRVAGRAAVSAFGGTAVTAAAALIVGAIANAAAEGAAYTKSLKAMGAAMVETGFDAATLNTALREAREGFEGPDEFIEASVLARASKGIIDLGKDSEFTSSQMKSLTDQQDRLAKALGKGDIEGAKTILEEMSTEAKGYADAAGEAAGETAGLNAETSELADGWTGAAEAVETYQSALAALRNVGRDVLQNEIDLHEAQTKTAEVFADSEATYDDKLSSLLDLAKANDDYVASLEASGASDAVVAEARAAGNAEQEGMLASLQEAYGLTDEQVQNLRESLLSLPATTPISVEFNPEEPKKGLADILTAVFALPPDTPVTVSTNDPEVIAALRSIGLTVVELPDGKGIVISATDLASAKAAYIASVVASIPSTKHVKITSSVGGPLGTGFISINGQIRGFAHGGRFRRGETAVVGEDGPELVQFDGNGEVIPNRQSMAMLGSGSPSGGVPGTAAAGRVVIDITGGDDDLRTLIRKWIRVDGLLVGT